MFVQGKTAFQRIKRFGLQSMPFKIPDLASFNMQIDLSNLLNVTLAEFDCRLIIELDWTVSISI